MHRIRFDSEHLDEISDAITRNDIRGLIAGERITVKPIVGTSRGRAHRKRLQRSKRGAKAGAKQGKAGARTVRKRAYVRKVRALRHLLKVAKDRKDITNREFWGLYKRVGGNTVRNKAHLIQLMAEAKAARAKAAGA